MYTQALIINVACDTLVLHLSPPYPNPLLTTTSQVLALCVMTRVRLCKTFYVTLDLPGLLWEFQSVQSLSRVQLFATP